MLCYEHVDMKMLEEDPTFVQAFASVGCLHFCQKLQDFHEKIAKDYAVNFTGIKAKVGRINFVVPSYTILHATKILRSGEVWLKV